MRVSLLLYKKVVWSQKDIKDFLDVVTGIKAMVQHNQKGADLLIVGDITGLGLIILKYVHESWGELSPDIQIPESHYASRVETYLQLLGRSFIDVRKEILNNEKVRTDIKCCHSDFALGF